MKRRYWKESEKEILRRDYPHMDTAELADKMNRSVKSVHQYAQFMKLKKTREFIRQQGLRHVEKLKRYRFHKGQEPPNKGKPMVEWMPPESIEGVKKGQFKKGQRPATAPPPGTILLSRHSRDGTMRYRVDGKWLHHIEWEKVNGPIPKDHALWCLSDDPLNCDPSNWELVSRAEMMRRNSYHNYPKEIVRAYAQIGALTRKINKRVKQLEDEKQNG